MSPAPVQPLTLPADDQAEGWVRERSATTLRRIRELVDGLTSAAPPSDALEVLRTWDEVGLEAATCSGITELLANVHPDESVRTASEESRVELDRLLTEIGQDAALYAVFAGLPTVGLDELALRLLDKTLTDFRRAGVDRDDATRARLVEINERLTTLDLEFSRVIRDDVRSIKVAPERLAGLPADWLAAHPAGEDGLVTVTTEYPDLVPVRMFCQDAEVRHDLVVTSLNRAYPHNDAVLSEMFALRHELATLVGYADWASYDADVKMIGSALDKAPGEGRDAPSRRIPEFVDRIAAAAEEPMRRDLDLLLARYRQDRPGATDVATPDASYYQELVRREQYDVDSQVVRTYFDFAKVRAGLLEVTGRLFGVRYEEVSAPVWHPDVTAYDVVRVEDGAALGRIYLDLHPREGKYNHAACFPIAPGLAGRVRAEGALVCNFGRGLMEHDHVVTLFHEFGHLVHHVLGGQGEWTRFAGIATEWDFVEAPSQMLEEWAWDPEILGSFATNEAGEPIPAELVAKMREADDYGKGLQARQQMFYAAVSYWFHADRPADLTARMAELQERYSPYPYLPDTHFYAGFGHLGGYSSAYYTYMWSLVIAKDMFSAFDPADLFDAEVAGRYRDRVLAPGGAKDAAVLVADFLGRPYSFEAYAAWLAK